MKKNIFSLDSINPRDSGLQSFNRSEFNVRLQAELSKNSEQDADTNYLRLLSLFVLGKHQEFESVIKADPSLIASSQFKALKLLNQLMRTQSVVAADIFPFGNQELFLRKKISKSIALDLITLYDSLKRVFVFPDCNFFALSEALPEIVFAYGIYIIENNLTAKFPELLQAIERHKEYLGAMDSAFLLALYYRRIGDLQQAELSLEQFRKANEPTNKKAKLKTIGNQKFFPAAQVFENWQSVLVECDQLQDEVLTRSGVHKESCEYFECSDCCKYTFPTMTETEYRYLHSWMQKNNYPIAKIKQKSEEIQAHYESLYSERLPVIIQEAAPDKVNPPENPHNFKFTCPFLDGDKCSCYEARPLVCRGFGLSSDNAISLKACQYYLVQYQNNEHPEHKRWVYDLRQAQMLAASGDRHINEGRVRKGTIVAWFSDNDA